MDRRVRGATYGVRPIPVGRPAAGASYSQRRMIETEVRFAQHEVLLEASEACDDSRAHRDCPTAPRVRRAHDQTEAKTVGVPSEVCDSIGGEVVPLASYRDPF